MSFLTAGFLALIFSLPHALMSRWINFSYGLDRLHMMRSLVLLFLFTAWSVCQAGCSDTLVAVPKSSGISIGDGGCEYEQEMIFDWEQPGQANSARKIVPFKSLCSWNKSGFSCNSQGSTVLAGATYKKVPGEKTVCGDPRWPVYRCTAGCNRRGVPLLFEIEPYGC